MAHLNAAEVECVKRLARAFEQETPVFSSRDPKALEELGLTEENYTPVLMTMEGLGAIDNVSHSSAGKFRHFTVTAIAAQMAREIDEQESKPPEAPDIVQQTIEQFRRHPVMGRIIFWGIALGALLTVITSVITLCEKIVNLFK